MSTFGIIGAGAFGTALACVFARAGHQALLWGRDPLQVATLVRTKQNARYLPGITLPDGVKPVPDIDQLKNAEVLFATAPAQQLRSLLAMPILDQVLAPLILCAKGIEPQTGMLQSQIVAEVRKNQPLAILSGPGFAPEMAIGRPTALTLACRHQGMAQTLQRLLSTDTLRLYRSLDVAGVQLGGALKNVLAIACGMVTGANMGESARAALMTRGYSEINRLAMAMGAEPATLAGLAGFGDMVLTCTSPQSRNFAFGESIGSGGTLSTGKTVEGIATAQAVVDLAERFSVDMPISQTVANVLGRNLTMRESLDTLMNRPLRSEA